MNGLVFFYSGFFIAALANFITTHDVVSGLLFLIFISLAMNEWETE